MPTTTEHPPATKADGVLISEYPKEHKHVGRSVAIALSVHILVAALVCLVTYWLGITTLKELFEKGGAIAETGAAPEEPMTVELQLDETPPPPTPNPLFVQEIVKPKVVPPPVPPKKPEPKPVDKPKPRYTAPNAKGQGLTQNVSAAKVGSSGLPHPSYPQAALNARQGGTVGMQVVFDAGGGIASADVTSSSGVTILDVSTRNFIFAHWKNDSLAGQTIHIPIVYDPSDSSGGH